MSTNPKINHVKDRETSCIYVEASLIDLEDFRLFDGKRAQQSSPLTYGTFLAGCEHSVRYASSAPKRRVVGWHPQHLHRGYDWQAHCYYIGNDESTAAEAASAYAATTIACCIIDGAARVRAGETVSVRFQGPLVGGHRGNMRVYRSDHYRCCYKLPGRLRYKK